MKIFKVIGFLILAVPAIVLLAIGPRAKYEAPKGVVVVEYWEKWTGEEGAALQAVVDDFNRTVGKEKGIYVNCLSASGVVQKTLVATAGGVPPDVAGLWDNILAQFAALGALEPLDDLAKAHGITEKTYKKVFWDECHYDNKLYALVSTPYVYALHYNTKIFEDSADRLRQAGLDPTRPPKTIAELDAYAQAIDVKNPDGTIRVTGYLPLEPGWDISYLPYQFGGTWWDAENKKFTFTDPKVIEAFKWVESYSKRLGRSAVSEFRSGFGNYDSPQNPFLAGTTSMVSQGTFFANVIHTKNKSMSKQWAAAPLPTLPGLAGTTSAQADILVIPKGAKHKKEAFEFIAYMNRQDVMEKLCNAHCKISPLAEVSEAFRANHNNPYIRVFEDLAAGPLARGTPSVPIMPQVIEEMTAFVQELAVLNVTPEAGLTAMQNRLQAKLDAFVAMQASRKTAVE